jgi:hypothetical protein
MFKLFIGLFVLTIAGPIQFAHVPVASFPERAACEAAAAEHMEALRAHWSATLPAGTPFRIVAICPEIEPEAEPEPKGEPAADFGPSFPHVMEQMVIAIATLHDRRVYRFPERFSAVDGKCDAARRAFRKTHIPLPGVRLYVECVPALPES